MRGDNIHSDDFNLTSDYGLTPLERAIADLYRGGEHDSEYTGNRKRCYMAFHPKASERTAEKRGSEFFKRPEVIAYLKAMARDVQQEVTFTSIDVLRKSIEHMRVCQGELPRKKAVFDEDGDPRSVEIYEYDIPGVSKAIELIGKNVNVNAFADKLDVKADGIEQLLPFFDKWRSREAEKA